VGPHTSNWDFILGRLAFYQYGVKGRYLMKKELFIGPLGWFLKAIGGIPVDRKKKNNLTDTAVKYFEENETMYMVFSPEGTRSYNPDWKKGFYYVAEKAKVPIYVAYIDFASKTGGFHSLVWPSGDADADIQKIKDIYMTSIDYDPKDEKTIEFFKIVQNKLLWAVSSQTAAELVYHRVDMSKPLLGMSSYDKENKNVTKNDVSIAKNYLSEDEIKLLGLLVEQYLAFAETMAMQQMPMTMKDWIVRLDAVISLNGRELLTHAGKISQTHAKEKSELEYQKFKDEQKKIEKIQSLKELEDDIKRLK
jgi:hypothetical protein